MRFRNLFKLLLNPVKLKRKLSREFGKNRDVFVISYPKSGRTWLRVMLDKLNINLKYIHDDSSWNDNSLSYYELDNNKSKYSNNRIIFLVRDPRDIIVSSYFQITKRDEKYDRTLPEFIRDERYGIKRVLKFYQIWGKNRKIPKDFLLIKYENMHKNILKELKRVITFLQINKPEEDLKKVTEFAKFNNMKKLEKQGFFEKEYGSILVTKNKSDNESFKLRKGKVGGFINYLNKEDIKFCNKCVSEIEKILLIIK